MRVSVRALRSRPTRGRWSRLRVVCAAFMFENHDYHLIRLCQLDMYVHNERASSMELKTAQPARHPSPTARATALTHLVFERPDLDRAARFLSDFALLVARRKADVLYMRGTSSSPYCYRVHRAPHTRFVGAGFSVGTREELERLARLQGGSEIATGAQSGGGEYVTLHDPSGFAVEIVHGRSASDRADGASSSDQIGLSARRPCRRRRAYRARIAARLERRRRTDCVRAQSAPASARATPRK